MNVKITIYYLFRRFFKLMKWTGDCSCQICRKYQCNNQCSSRKSKLYCNQPFLHADRILIIYFRIIFSYLTYFYKCSHCLVHQRLIFIKQHILCSLHVGFCKRNYSFLKLYCLCYIFRKLTQQCRIILKIFIYPSCIFFHKSHLFVGILQICIFFAAVIFHCNKCKILDNHLKSAAHTHYLVGNLIADMIKLRVSVCVFLQPIRSYDDSCTK